MTTPVSPAPATAAEPWHLTVTTKVTIESLAFTITKSSTSSHVPPPPAPATPDNNAVLGGLMALKQVLDMIVARLDASAPASTPPDDGDGTGNA